MGIDRIGKGGTPPVDVGGATGAGAAGATAPTTPFSVDAPHAAQPTDAATGIDASSPLARLRAGEIDVNGYVDAKVDEATRGIELPKTDLADLKAMLREQMVSDPSLVDLVNHSTGHTPTPPHDEE